MQETIKTTKLLIKQNKKYFILAMLFNLIFSSTIIFYAEVFKAFFDNATNGIISNNYKYLIIVIGLILTQVLTHYLASLYTNKLYLRVKKGLQLLFTKGVLAKDQQTIEEYDNGEILSYIIADIDNISRLSTTTFIKFLQIAFKTIILICYLIYVNVWLGLVSILFSPFMLMLAKYFAEKIKRHNVNFSKQNAKTTSQINQTLQLNSFLKLQDSNQYVDTYLEREINKLLLVASRTYNVSLMYDEISSGLGSLANVTILFLGAFFVSSKQLTTGELVAFMQILNQVIWPLVSLNSMYGAMQAGLGHLKNLDQILKIKTQTRQYFTHSKESLIIFDSVSFSYESEKVIKDLSFDIGHRELLLIKGKNGAGKSTVINLLLGIYKSNTGEVSYSGIDGELSDHIAYSSQMPVIIPGSIKENMQIEKTINMSRAEALFHDFEMTEELPGVFDTTLSFGGANLSGGQAKKISLIRAFAANKPVIVLDEPFANLDRKSVQLVKEEIVKLSMSKAVVVVVHNDILDDESTKIIELVK